MVTTSSTLLWPFPTQSQATQTLRCQTAIRTGDIFFVSPSQDAYTRFLTELQKNAPHIKIEALPAGAVVPAWGIPEAVGKGTLDCGLVSTDALARVAEGFKIFERPFSFRDLGDVLSFEKGEAGRLLEQQLEKAGISLVAYVGGQFSMVASKVKLSDPDMLKGAKLGTTQSRRSVQGLSVYGASILLLRDADLAPSINAGVIDGFVGSLSDLAANAPTAKLEILPIRQSFQGYALVFNRARLASLDEKAKRVIQAAARPASVMGTRNSAAQFQEAIRSLERSGSSVSELSRGARAAFIASGAKWDATAPKAASALTKYLSVAATGDGGPSCTKLNECICADKTCSPTCCLEPQ